jgi:hypothetical protein
MMHVSINVANFIILPDAKPRWTTGAERSEERKCRLVGYTVVVKLQYMVKCN